MAFWYGHTGGVSPGLVYRAIRRLAIDWARSIDRRTIREQKTFELTPLSSSFDYTLEKDERQQALLRAVDRLPDQQKVLTLKIWGELTFDEIARTLDMSLNTVASRYRYALKKLKDWVPEEPIQPQFTSIVNEFDSIRQALHQSLRRQS